MKFVSQLSQVACVVLLGAVSQAAAPLSASKSEEPKDPALIENQGHGVWMKASERATLVQARLMDGKGNAKYRIEAALIGKDSGFFGGEMREIVAPGVSTLVNLRYMLDGEFIRLDAHTLYVRAQISLDLSAFGVDQPVACGVLDGQLLDFGGAGYCPVPLPGGKHVDDPTAIGGDVLELGEIDAQLVPAAAAAGDEGKGRGLEPVEPSLRDELVRGRFAAQYVMF